MSRRNIQTIVRITCTYVLYKTTDTLDLMSVHFGIVMPHSGHIAILTVWVSLLSLFGHIYIDCSVCCSVNPIYLYYH